MIDVFSSSPLRLFGRHPRTRGAQTFRLDQGPLLPRPIDPSCIEEGTPEARCTTFTESPDKRLSSGLWECTAGKFKVAFAVDEIVHILDGEVIVREDGGGAVHTLRPGDAAYFPLGLVTHWHVPQFVRKFFVVRMPGGNARIARARQRLGM